jgi:uncharacterized protein (TIGR02266 family)
MTKLKTREHLRFAVSIPVDCSTPDFSFSDYVCNIGRGGLFIRSSRPLPLDSDVRLAICLGETGQRIHARGRVIWNCHVSRAASHIVTGSGVRFLEMSASDRAALESYLARLTPTPTPSPRPHVLGTISLRGGEDLTTFVGRGDLDFRELIEAYQCFVRRAPSRLVLWDLREAKLAGDRGDVAVWNLAVKATRASKGRRTKGRTAIVCSCLEDLNQAGTLRTYLRVVGYPVEVKEFADLASATSWLASPC